MCICIYIYVYIHTYIHTIIQGHVGLRVSKNERLQLQE